jgi:hypothetical protein
VLAVGDVEDLDEAPENEVEAAEERLPPYAVGSLAVFWVIDRLRAIFS